MSRQGHSHGWAKAHSFGSQVQPPWMSVSPTKGIYYRQKYYSAAPLHRRSCRWRSWMWRFWAGVITHTMWLCSRLDVLPNSIKTLLEAAYGRKMNMKLSGNSSVGHSCSQHAIMALCCVTKLHNLEWPFTVPCLRIMLFISFLICHTCQVDGLSW